MRGRWLMDLWRATTSPTAPYSSLDSNQMARKEEEKTEPQRFGLKSIVSFFGLSSGFSSSRQWLIWKRHAAAGSRKDSNRNIIIIILIPPSSGHFPSDNDAARINRVSMHRWVHSNQIAFLKKNRAFPYTAVRVVQNVTARWQCKP